MKVERLNESRERIHIYVNQRSPALNQTRANTPFLPSPNHPRIAGVQKPTLFVFIILLE